MAVDHFTSGVAGVDDCHIEILSRLNLVEIAMVALRLLGLVTKSIIESQAPVLDRKKFVVQNLTGPRGDISKNYFAARGVGDDDAEWSS